MSHDFATSRRPQSRKKKPPSIPWWVWMSSGVVIGVFVVFLVYLSGLAPLPPPEQVAVPKPQSQREAPPEPSAEEQRKVAKPVFEFYTRLPESEVIVETPDVVDSSVTPAVQQTPVTTPAAVPVDPAAPVTVDLAAEGTDGQPVTASATIPAAPEPLAQEPVKKDVYTLQVGSFRQKQQAETLRAQLLLLGMDVNVQAVVAQGETWYRVLVGPFTSTNDVAAARSTLLQNNMHPVVLKLK